MRFEPWASTSDPRDCDLSPAGDAVLIHSPADGEIMWNKSEVHAGDYHLVSADMRKLSEVEKKLMDCGLDKNLPTLFISECVLVYIDTKHTEQLIRWISDNIPTAMFINYEQVCVPACMGELTVVSLWWRIC